MVAAIRTLSSSGRLDYAVWRVRIVAAAIAIAATTTQLIDFAVYDQRLGPLDMMTHNSIFGITSLAALALAAVASLAAALRGGERSRELVGLSALLALLLALRIAHPAHVLLIAVPLGAAALTLLWSAAPGGTARRVLREGCIVLVVAFVVHGIGTKVVSMLGLGPETWGYQLKAVVKHSGELAGWVLIAGGLVAAAAAARPQLGRES